MSDFTVVSDSREKLPYSFSSDVSTVEKALETGDYTIEGFEDVFAVERKTLPDFLKSITWDRERFKKEIVRADDMIAFVVVIEAPQKQILEWDYDRDVHPNSVIGTIDNWEKYHTVEFQWAGDRENAEKITHDTLERWYNAYRSFYD